MNREIRSDLAKIELFECNDLMDLQNKFAEEGMVVCYLDNRIIIGDFNRAGFKFSDNLVPEFRFIQKIRIFNKKQELFGWRSGDKIKARLRIDGTGEPCEFLDSVLSLSGTRKEPLHDGFCRLTESRGTCIILPDKNFLVDEGANRVGIGVRNYIDYTNSCQATFCDSRFLGFVQMGGKK